MQPDIVVDGYVHYLRGGTVENGEGFGSDLMVEMEEGGGDELGQVDVCLELAGVRTTDGRIAGRWE